MPLAGFLTRLAWGILLQFRQGIHRQFPSVFVLFMILFGFSRSLVSITPKHFNLAAESLDRCIHVPR